MPHSPELQAKRTTVAHQIAIGIPSTLLLLVALYLYLPPPQIDGSLDRLILALRCDAIAALTLLALACKSSGSPPVASPPPEPAPAPAPEPAPEPTPEPAPAPGPDKAAITSILDEIDSHLAELAKGHKGSEHRDAIEKLVSQLEPLLAGFEPGTAPYAKLKEHAKKFHDAQMKTGNSKDAGSHRMQVEDAVKELRSTL